MALRKSQRANCGVNPSVEMMVGVNDELERKAQRYLWVFFTKNMTSSHLKLSLTAYDGPRSTQRR